jgi:hypothetical protein
MLAAIDWSSLLKVIYSSLVTGVGLTFVLCLTIIGSIRSSDARSSGNSPGAIGFGALGIFGVLAIVAAMVYGFVLMTSK